MATGFGFSKTVTEGLVVGYDTGDGVNSYKGKPTTNVFTHYGNVGYGAAANNNVGFQVNGTGTFVRLGWGQTFGGYTIKPEDVVYRYDLGANGCHYHGSTATISAGQYAIMSVDYYLSPDVVVENSTLLVFENYGGSAVGGGASLPDTTPGKWHRMTLVSGPAGGTGTQASFLYPGSCGPRMSAQGYILMKNPQVEFSSSPVVTPFVNTTRSSTRSLLDVKSAATINVLESSFDSTGKPIFDGTNDYLDLGQDVQISDTNQGWTAEYVFKTNDASTLQHFNSAEADDFNANWLALYGNKLAVWNVSPGYWKFGDTVFSSNRYYHVAFVCDPGGTNYKFYVNGVQEGGDHVGNSWVAAYSRLLVRYIGRYEYDNSYSRYFTGEIPVAKFYNRALATGELLQNYFNYSARFNMYEYRYAEGNDATRFVNNWNNTTTYTMADFGGLGAVTAHGWSTGPATYTLTLGGLPAHTQVRYKVFWHCVDSVDNETNRLFIGDGSSNGELLTFTKLYNAAPNVSYAATGVTATWSGSKTYSYRPWANGAYNADGYLLIDTGWKSHTASTFTASHLMGADQPQSDEAMYLSHVEVLVRY